jgi:site-specific recombinase XerD
LGLDHLEHQSPPGNGQAFPGDPGAVHLRRQPAVWGDPGESQGEAIEFAYLSPRALKLLRRYLRERPAAAPTDRLWLSEDGEAFAYWGYESVFRGLKRRSGVLRVRNHLLRHHFAQVVVEKGAERAAVQELLGHRTKAMTWRYTASVRRLSASKLMPK